MKQVLTMYLWGLCVIGLGSICLTLNYTGEMADHPPSVAREAVLKPSAELINMPKIRGYDFNKGLDHRALLQSYLTTGFQASNMGLAVNEINRMVRGMGGRETDKTECFYVA